MTNKLKNLLSWSLQIAEKNQLTVTAAQLDIVSGDASFRKYYRLNATPFNLIIVDSPPDKESNDEFIAITKHWFEQGINTPKVFAYDKAQGFMALSDLGSELLLPNLTADNVDGYYKQALAELSLIAKTYSPKDYQLPEYNEAKLLEEMQLFPEWFCKTHLALESIDIDLESSFKFLINNAKNQSQVTVHRDFHSRNIMLTGDKLGIIDFQDAVKGALTYDLVSLLKDCYVVWPRTHVLNWVEYFREQVKSELSKDDFVKAFDLMGLQRHFKVLGIFARLNHRDGKTAYLDDLPLVLAYTVDATARYEEFSAINQWFENVILPRYFEKFPAHEALYHKHLGIIQS